MNSKLYFRRHRRRLNEIIEIGSDYAVIKVIRRRLGEIIYFKIDQRHIDLVKNYRWFCHEGYCATHISGKKFLYLHNLLFRKPEKDFVLHHVNGDRGDNRSVNIQLVTWSEHNMLKKVKENHTTAIRGISQYRDGSYNALIGSECKRKSFRSRGPAQKARKEYEEMVQTRIRERTACFFEELDARPNPRALSKVSNVS